MRLLATASQTAGPYFRIGFAWFYVDDLGGEGERVVVQGRVYDGERAPVPDACLELWRAEPPGFGRVPTDAAGVFRFATIVPGRVPGGGGRLQAPHVAVALFARGVLRRMATRMYFPGEAANADDPVLALVPPARRATLIARPVRAGVVEWNVVLQGEGETVFFELP
ncbi:MAG TPA: hypothetical protein VKE22_21850 [Haliangiales bacterium]|nr:hypothetical protein [Haliangiales bacterium]